MFERESNPLKIISKSMPSLVSKTLEIKGDLISSGIVEVEGKITGNISAHTLTLRENAEVAGDIYAQIANMKGKFTGNVYAEKINISGEARIDGHMEYVSLSVENGASIEGQLKRVKAKEEIKQLKSAVIKSDAK